MKKMSSGEDRFILTFQYMPKMIIAGLEHIGH